MAYFEALSGNPAERTEEYHERTDHLMKGYRLSEASRGFIRRLCEVLLKFAAIVLNSATIAHQHDNYLLERSSTLYTCRQVLRLDLSN
jgi:hypothetical protein